MINKAFKGIYSAFIFLFLYAPIAVLAALSFNDSKSRIKWGGFTLKWYEKLFQNDEVLRALFNTITIALLSAAIAAVIGTAAAIGVHSMNSIGKNVILNITYLPVLNPDIVTGVSLLILFVSIGISLGYISLLLAHITFNIPYVILSVLPKLKQMNKNSYEAALDLGASPAAAIRKVILPEIMPGIITGFLLAVTMSIDDFVISFFTTGPGVSTLSITVYSMTRRAIPPEINALSTLMFIVVLALLIIINVRTSNRDEAKKKGAGSFK